MYTQCPECLTIYRIVAESLAGGRGSFRCGHCGHVFDALPTLIEKLPLEVIGELPRHPEPVAPPVLAVPAMHPKSRPAALSGIDDSDSGEPERREPILPGDWLAQVPPTLNDPVARAKFDVRDTSRPGLRTPTPGSGPRPMTATRPGGAGSRAPGSSQTRPAMPVREQASAFWSVASVLLVLVLAGQIAWGERERLLAQPELRSWAETAVGWFGGRLPPLSDPERLTLSSREVGPHPSVPGALLISAGVRNDSPLVLAYPLVEIRMTNLAGKAIALRRFAPEEYLNDPEGAARGLQPGALVPLVFEVVDPGRDALNYEFAFRQP